MAVPILVINLDEAQERWHHMETTVRGVLPHHPLVRIPAVDVRRKTLDDPSLPLSPLARWRLQRPGRRLCSRMVITHLSAVGCSLSHIRCWQWLVDRPQWSYALILEDDACLDEITFARRWEREVEPILELPERFAAGVCPRPAENGHRSVRLPSSRIQLARRTAPCAHPIRCGAHIGSQPGNFF